MNSSALGRDVCDEMCKRMMGGEEKEMARQQATGDGFECAPATLREVTLQSCQIQCSWL